MDLLTLPHSVFINYEFIKTISFNNLNASFSEVLKYGLIYNQKLWQELDSSLLTCSDLSHLIEKCVRIKLDVVKKDYYDNDIRRILNFGHTISHAIESTYLQNNLKISHGDALAVGLICETYLSYVEFGFSSQKLNHVVDKISSFFNFKKIETLDHKLIMKFIKNDKKSSNGSNNFTLIKDIGTVVINYNVSNAKIADALSYFKNMSSISLSLGAVINKDASFILSGSKSITQRALIINSFFENKTISKDYSDSDDSNLLKACIQSNEKIINVSNSGTTLRFLISYYLLKEIK